MSPTESRKVFEIELLLERRAQRRRLRYAAKIVLLVSVRPRVFAFVFFASCALVTLGVIGSALGVW